MTEGFRGRAAKLAAAAAALKSAGGPLAAGAPASLAFLTDRRRGPDALLVARALPRGAALIFRDYDDPRRTATARALKAACAARGVLFFVGGDEKTAKAVEADGLHLRADQLAAPPVAEGLLISASCHSPAEIAQAQMAGADFIFLSPALATASHPGAEALGPERFRKIAAASPLPVLALGGVDEANAPLLAGRNVAGFGAIGAFAPR